MKLGAHTPFTKGNKYLIGSNEFCKQIGANAMMIYLGAPQNSYRAPIEEYQLDEFNKSKVVANKDIVVHAPYIVNPASKEKHGFATEFLIKDCQRMNYIGAKYMVLHPGAHTKTPREESLEILINSLKKILSKTKDVNIALETMAGKGTELGTTFEELKYIIDKLNSDRISICLDTCHIWEAGYDVKNYDNLINELKKYDLLKLIKVIHVNDSKNPMGAKKDRHENIGKGFIGLEALRKIVHSKEFKDSIKILETPYIDKKPPYKEEIELLK